MRTTLRVLFVLYLIVVSVALLVVCMDPFWRHGGYNGYMGWLATAVAAFPWTLFISAAEGMGVSRYISEDGLGFVLWGLVVLNIALLYKGAFPRKRTSD